MIKKILWKLQILGRQILFKFKPIEDYDFIISKIKQVTKNVLTVAKKYLNFKKMTILTLQGKLFKRNEFICKNNRIIIYNF